MTEPFFSVVIPYKQRLDNIRALFESLAGQTFDRSRFEVVVGAMEYCTDYVLACREFAADLNIVTVMTTGEWNVCRARNTALRQASGRVVVVLDADMVLPTGFLTNLHERHFAGGRDVCVLGQMLDAHHNMAEGVSHPEVRPYRHYRDQLAELDATGGVPSGVPGDVHSDRRLPVFEAGPPMPWALVWTAVVALPAALIHRHDLFFDEQFRGWGPEDQEWGYRISRTGTPIMLAPDVYAIHQPHVRDASVNQDTHRRNSRHFLAKWPAPDVEFALAFGSLGGNRHYREFQRELAGVAPGALAVARGTVAGAAVLVVGLVADDQRYPAADALFGDGGPDEVLPLVGFRLPYADLSIDEAVLLPPVLRLSARYRDGVLREVARVAHAVRHGADDAGRHVPTIS